MSKTVTLKHPTENKKYKEIQTGGFSLGGLLLGPFLYFGWGMWRKGLIIIGALVIAFIFVFLVGGISGNAQLEELIARLVSGAFPIYCAFAINKDRYNHLLNTGWKEA